MSSRGIRAPLRGPTRLLIAGAIALVAVGLAAGCGDDSNGSGSDDKVQVYYLIPSLSNEAYIGLKEGAEAQAAEETDADVTVDAPSTGIGSANQLIPKLEGALTRGVDAIAVNSGAAENELVPVLQRAIDEGVKVILFDVQLDELEGASSFVAIDEANTSPAGGEFVKEQLPDGGKLFILSCVPDHPVTVARTDGFMAGLEGWKGEIIGTGDSECDEAKARTIMENTITANPDLDAVYSTTAQATDGGIKALQAANKDVLWVSHDATPEHAELILQDNVIDADIINPFQEIGAVTLSTAIAAAKGEEVDEEILLKGGLVTKQNAEEFIADLQEFEN
jgi:ABC-type sugar transport system substrate-binding protein